MWTEPIFPMYIFSNVYADNIIYDKNNKLLLFSHFGISLDQLFYDSGHQVNQ